MKKIIGIVLLGVLTLTGCRSKKETMTMSVDPGTYNVVVNENGRVTSITPVTSATNPSATHTPSKNTQVQTQKGTNQDLAQSATGINALSSKMDLTLTSGRKSIKVGGTYRLRRNDVIQINLTYTLLVLPVNVGTLELTQDSILVLDRINNQYCRAAYSDVPALKKAGVDFNFLQKVFWGESKDLNNKNFQCTYGNWTKLGKGQFPKEIEFKLIYGKSSYSANFTLDNPKENDDWASRTKVNSKYKAVSIETVMSKLMSVAK